MKKLILLAFVSMIFISCADVDSQVDPLDYKGCVIDDKIRIAFGYHGLVLKLTDSLRSQHGQTYWQIEVSHREYQQYSIGDTIK